MKVLWNVIAVLLLIPLVAALGFVGWLRSSGRLDRRRLDTVVALFKTTLAEEQQQLEQARQDAQQQLEKRQAMARLEEVAEGPTTVSDRLRKGQEDDEVGLLKLEWTRRAVADLLANIENAKSELTRRRDEDEAERQAFEQRMAKKIDQLKDENFQHAVSIYEQLKPDQAKQNFLELIEQGREDQVVDYLAAMELRKAAKVLAQFETPTEVPVGTRLIQRLRQRGIEPRPNTAGTNQATGNPK